MAYHDNTRVGALVEQISVLADLRQKEGDFRKAESLYREALYRAQELKKADPGLLCGILSLLAHLYYRWGRMDKAAEFYEKALKIADKNGLNDNDKVATIKNNLAMIFKQSREYVKAEHLLLHAFAYRFIEIFAPHLKAKDLLEAALSRLSLRALKPGAENSEVPIPAYGA